MNKSDIIEKLHSLTPKLKNLFSFFTRGSNFKFQEVNGFKELNNLQHKVLDQRIHTIKPINILNEEQLSSLEWFKSVFLPSLKASDIFELLSWIEKSPKEFFFLHVQDISFSRIFLIDNRTQVLLLNMNQIISTNKNNVSQEYLAQIIDVDKNEDNCYMIETLEFEAQKILVNHDAYNFNKSHLINWIKANALEILPITHRGYGNSPGAEVTGLDTQQIKFTYAYVVDFKYILFRKKLTH